MAIPHPDQLRSNTTIKLRIVGDKQAGSKSKARFDLYRSATTPAEYFRLHPGPTEATGRVSAGNDWKNDVRKKLVVFEDHRYRALAEHYGMQGGELVYWLSQGTNPVP